MKMIKIGDTYYRNLEEQVLKNKEDIARHYAKDEVLSNFGIKIIGEVQSVDQLTPATEYQGQYGDAFAVGEPGNYTYYIFTRPNQAIGQVDNQWLDVGQLAMKGDKGEPGEQGPEGPIGKSTRWYTGPEVPTNSTAYLPGDMYFKTADPGLGDIYLSQGVYHESQYWTLVANIRGATGLTGMTGPQGPQGPQGERGPEGPRGATGSFNIGGILGANVPLPNPTTLNDLTVAYLKGDSIPYDLYIQVGLTPETAIWANQGPFNAATAVSVGGNYQSVWNADTKLDRATHQTDYNQVYIKTAVGDEAYINVTKQTIADAVVQRNSTGTITSVYPNNDSDVATKAYVDTKTVAKVSTNTGIRRAYTITESGEPQMMNISSDAAPGLVVPYSLVRRSNTTIKTVDPIDDLDCANKRYVDSVHGSWVHITGGAESFTRIDFPAMEVGDVWILEVASIITNDYLYINRQYTAASYPRKMSIYKNGQSSYIINSLVSHTQPTTQSEAYVGVYTYDTSTPLNCYYKFNKIS